MGIRLLASSGFSRYCYPGFKASARSTCDRKRGKGGGRVEMFSSWRKSSRQLNASDPRGEGPWLAMSLRPENFVPGLVVGFLLGLFLDLSPLGRGGKSPSARGKQRTAAIADSNGEELKMVLVVRQDLKMGAGKIASQCAHAATGTYAELIHSVDELGVCGSHYCFWAHEPEGKDHSSMVVINFGSARSGHRSLLRRWEQCGQPKIVLCCKNQQEMNKLKETADRAGLPTFVVADAGRTQVAAGSKTVLAIGPGRKALVDSITGRLRLM